MKKLVNLAIRDRAVLDTKSPGLGRELLGRPGADVGSDPYPDGGVAAGAARQGKCNPRPDLDLLYFHFSEPTGMGSPFAEAQSPLDGAVKR